jgi:lipoate-protein ligase A
MHCLSLQTHDPYFNLAAEEYLLKNSAEEYFILGINTPSVIIGKHQSPHREVNTEYITQNNIPLIRRITGGGAVFHDTGNLNFTFIENCEPGRQVDFRKHTKPVIDFLSSQGVEARFEGKSDLKVNGLKISGNAEHVHRNRLIHHGTLLFSSDLEMLKSSLRKDTSCYTTRAVESNPSHVGNLCGLIPPVRDISAFRESLMNYFISETPGTKDFRLSENDIRNIRTLADSKYRSWEWNWAYGPEYRFVKEFDYQQYTIICNLTVKEGIIMECTLKGHPELEELSARLVGIRHMVEDMEEVFTVGNASDIVIYNFF